MPIPDPSASAAFSAGRGAPARWRAALRSAGLLLTIAGLLLIGFQSRTYPRSPQKGPAKITRAAAGAVKFPPPERKELGPDQTGESTAAEFVPPPIAAMPSAPPRPAVFREAQGGPGIRLRAPPIELRLI